MLFVVDLVYHQHDRRFRFAQDPRQLLVDRRKPVLGIDHKKNHVALTHGRVGRGSHLRRQFRLTRATDSSGVPDQERSPSSRAGGGEAVAGNARLIVHDGDVPAGQAIEER
jgi:hypothetical protein